MAKVTGPLMSMSASGTVGKSIVFSIWKGAAYVRQWLKPANPQTADQGAVRVIVGGAGRVSGKVRPTSDFEGQLITLGVIPSGQSKQSYLVKKMVRDIIVNPAGLVSIQSAFDLHTQKAVFTSEAAGIGITDMSLAYAGGATFTRGEQLYALALTAIAAGLTGVPYNVAIADWSEANIQAMVSDMAAAV